ncbi:DNA polymerase I [bacterium]|nr:DNA polymerase I [bacterium]
MGGELMENEGRKLVLVDGHATAFRAYHGMGVNLSNSKGEPTAAVLGFLNLFNAVRKATEPEFIAVVFDPPGGSFRNEVYPEYKAHRPPMPEELRQQMRRIREALEAMQVPVLEMSGFEADDVIGSLAVRAVEAGGTALVCSVDKDLLQVVRPGIRIWREHLQTLEVMDEEAVVRKLGVRPDQVATYLGLVGDSSDNIPGVPGVGAKTAAALLQEYGTLEAILEAAPAITKKKLSENLQAYADKAFLSRDLATLRLDCVPSLDWEQFRWSFKPSRAIREFYREMEFQSLLKELGGETIEERTTDYATIRTSEQLAAVVAGIRKARLAAIDTETTDLDVLTAELVGISLSWGLNQAVYIPVGHHDTSGSQLTLDAVRDALNGLFDDPSVRWVAHHWGYDYKILLGAGFHAPRVHGDTMIASYLANPERQGSNRLKDLAVQWLGIQMTEIRELIGGGDDLISMASVTVEDSSRYACQDADATLQLHHKLEEQIQRNELDTVYRQVELPLSNVLSHMELEGVRIDRPWFAEMSRKAEFQLDEIASEIYGIAGKIFKINSPKQVAELLFEDLKLPSQKKGKSGAYSTDVTVLESISHLHPLPAKLLEYRQIEKLKGTYIDPLPTMIHPKTGRVHTSFNQTVAATGRLSSSNPNLQNIPVRSDAGKLIRQGFIPRAEGWKLIAADYSQIELRILAHLSGDEALIEAFTSGADVHAMTASRIFGLPLGEVTSAQRGQAKAINFGIIYGMSDSRLSRDLELSKSDAKRFIEDYFRVYSGVHRFIESTKEQAKRDGFVSTILGRRRFIADIDSRNFSARSFAERIAVNTPIQGTSADMIKLAMIRVDERIRREKLAGRMILQVHDELIIDAPESEVEAMTRILREEMAAALPLRVPIVVDVAVGNNWAEC